MFKRHLHKIWKLHFLNMEQNAHKFHPFLRNAIGYNFFLYWQRTERIIDTYVIFIWTICIIDPRGRLLLPKFNWIWKHIANLVNFSLLEINFWSVVDNSLHGSINAKSLDLQVITCDGYLNSNTVFIILWLFFRSFLVFVDLIKQDGMLISFVMICM